MNARRAITGCTARFADAGARMKGTVHDGFVRRYETLVCTTLQAEACLLDGQRPA